MKTRRAKLYLLAMIEIFALPPMAHATVFQINAPGSTYEYLVPPEGPGVPGCQPDDFHCAFGISGTLEFDIDQMAGSGSFVAANVRLSGNEATSAGPSFPADHADGVESFLIDLGPFPLQSSAGGTLLFYQTTPSYNDLEIRVMGNQLSLSGAYDLTPADGAGHAFDLTGAAVPEPETALIALCYLAATTLTIRRPNCVYRTYQR